MILAIDIGNTTVALGGIRDGRVCFVARMDTVRTRTAAEYRAEMDKIFAHRRHPERPMRFEGAVLTSVVPQITGALAECARHYTGKKPVIVSPDIRTGLTMGVDEPRAVGKDRLVDAAYAAANFPLPIVTVDLGTATTFNVVDKDRVFRGGVICPGLSTGLRALGERCAQLPQVHLGSPKKAIGTNTESCMLSGSVLGTAVLIDGMVQRIEEELGLSLRVPEVSLQHCRHSMSRHKLQAHIPRKTWRLWQHRFPLIRSRWTVRQPSWKHPETRSQQQEVNWRVV